MPPNGFAPRRRKLAPRPGALIVAGLMLVGCEAPSSDDVESEGHALGTKFPLVCRGGVNNSSSFPLQLLQSFGDDGTAYNELQFDRSPVAGNNSSAMPAGSCAWQDRPIAQSEPARICLDGSSFVWHVRSRYEWPYQVRASWTGADPPVPSNANLQAMIDLMFSDATRFRTFMVANDFGGCLRTQ